MITRVIVKDNTNTPLSYLPKIFPNGTEIKFKPGINIIVGNNGSGKTTLLNLIRHYTLCTEQIMSECYPNDLDFLPYFEMLNFVQNNSKKDEELLDGVLVKGDYANKVFNFTPHQKGNQVYTRRAIKMALAGSGKSTGETLVASLSEFFGEIFSESDVKFPKEGIKKLINRSNSLYKKRFNNLLKYFDENTENADVPEFTVLMDEPDRNLDTKNLEEIFSIVSTRKEYTQLICVLHNQPLIYRLSKMEGINFVELSEGYIKDIQKFIEKCF